MLLYRTGGGFGSCRRAARREVGMGVGVREMLGTVAQVVLWSGASERLESLSLPVWLRRSLQTRPSRVLAGLQRRHLGELLRFVLRRLGLSRRWRGRLFASGARRRRMRLLLGRARRGWIREVRREVTGIRGCLMSGPGRVLRIVARNGNRRQTLEPRT